MWPSNNFRPYPIKSFEPDRRRWAAATWADWSETIGQQNPSDCIVSVDWSSALRETYPFVTSVSEKTMLDGIRLVTSPNNSDDHLSGFRYFQQSFNEEGFYAGEVWATPPWLKEARMALDASVILQNSIPVDTEQWETPAAWVQQAREAITSVHDGILHVTKAQEAIKAVWGLDDNRNVNEYCSFAAIPDRIKEQWQKYALQANEFSRLLQFESVVDESLLNELAELTFETAIVAYDEAVKYKRQWQFYYTAVSSGRFFLENRISIAVLLRLWVDLGYFAAAHRGGRRNRRKRRITARTCFTFIQGACSIFVRGGAQVRGGAPCLAFKNAAICSVASLVP